MSDKAAVLKMHRAAYDEFRHAVAGLSDAQLTKPFLDTWSVREIAAHIAGWHAQLTTGLERVAQGQRPSPEGVNWGDIQGWNDRFGAGAMDRSAADWLAELDQRVTAFAAAIQAIPDDRFGEGKTVNRLAAGAGYEHLHEHAEEIAAARAAGSI